MIKPLEGIKVLELGSWIAAPAASRILRYLGAEIIKVEPRDGDALRGMANPARRPGINPVFEITNYGKRSIGLDLRTDGGRDIFLALSRKSDVLLTNIRSSSLETLRIDYESVRPEAPRLVYCLVSGYGLTGPQRDRPAFDGTAYWAESGMAALISEGLDAPVFPRAAIGDHFTAMTAVAGICAALVRRGISGEGQFVTASLAGAGTFSLSWDFGNFEWVGMAAPNPTRLQVTNPLNSYYRCKDGRWIALVNLQSDRAWPGVCRAFDADELLADGRYATAKLRAVNHAQLISELDALFAGCDSREVGEKLEANDVIWALVSTPADVMDDAHLASGITQRIVINGAEHTIPAIPMKFAELEEDEGGDVPELGQHTEEILLELGLTWEQVALAKEAGAIT